MVVMIKVVMVNHDGNFKHQLVGGWPTPLNKYIKMMEFVSWDDDIPNIWEQKTCSKPPTR